MQGLSAGRVQSVATRLVVERERERWRSSRAGYWDIRGRLRSRHVRGAARRASTASASRRAATSPSRASCASDELVRLDEAEARGLAAELEGLTFAVRSADEKPYTRRPAAPFMTSTLQQEASRKLRFTLADDDARRPAPVRERLHHLHAHRLDDAVGVGAHGRARARPSSSTAPTRSRSAPRRYTRKVKNAQEAHEAIRPAGDSFRTPKQLERELSRDELALYDLIWKRTLASQMADARGLTVSLRLGATTPTGRDAEFARLGHGDHLPRLPRRLRGGPRRRQRTKEEERPLPHLKPGDELSALELEPEGHATTPPARYTEASLVQALEERGIGRPVDLRLDHGHDPRPRLRLQARHGARPVLPRLRRHRAARAALRPARRLRLHRADGGRPRPDRGRREERVDWLRRFYFGGRRRRRGPARARLRPLARSTRARSTRSRSATAGSSLRVGRYGPYVERGEERASVPEDMAPDELTVEKAEELLSAPSGDRVARRAPRVGHARSSCEGRPLRAVRDRGAARGRDREAAHRLALPVDVARDGHARRGGAAAVAAAHARRRPRRRGDRSSRTAATGRTSRRAPRRARSSPRSSSSRSRSRRRSRCSRSRSSAAAAARAKPPLRELGPDPVERQAGRAQGGPFRPVRDRRRDEREPAPRRRSRDGDDRAGGRAARRAAREGPGAEAEAGRRPPRRRASVRTNVQTFSADRRLCSRRRDQTR